MSEVESVWLRRLKRSGDAEAASSLVRAYYREVAVFVSRQLAGDHAAEDVTQEVFVAALRYIGGFDERKASFRTWLYRIATNKVIDHLRGRRVWSDLPDNADVVDVTASVDLAEVLADREVAVRLHAAVATLPARAQQVIRLRLFSDSTFAEVADALGVPEATAKTSYYRALTRLRGELSDVR